MTRREDAEGRSEVEVKSDAVPDSLFRLQREANDALGRSEKPEEAAQRAVKQMRVRRLIMHEWRVVSSEG